MNRHPETLRAKAKTHNITRLQDGSYQVISGSTGNTYLVTQLPGRQAYSCTCDWAAYRPDENNGACGCSHVIAVIAFDQAERARSTKVYNDMAQARRQHRQIIDIEDGLIITTRKVA